jgi:adenosylcobinamide-GDP ribazoletransferase
MELRALVAALSFLTRIPVGNRLAVGADDVARAGPGFPLVGAGVGATVGVTAAALSGLLPPLPAAAVAVTVGVLLTGALHLDALADTADALGGRSFEGALEIMRDHAIGAYGAVSIALDLLMRAGVLTALISSGHVVAVAVTAGALSRGAPVALAAALPYARAGGGAGASLTQGSCVRAAVAAVFAVGIAAGVMGVPGVLVAGCAAAVVALLALAFRRWLGGVTGDMLGAAVELSEVAVLVAAVALGGGR